MRVDFPQVHVAVAFVVIAPPAEEAAKKLELRGADMGQAMPLEVHFHDCLALRQGLDQVVEMIHQVVHLFFATDPVDHRFHRILLARRRFLRRNRAGAFEGSEPDFSKSPAPPQLCGRDFFGS
jgi:hypothetical protein